MYKYQWQFTWNYILHVCVRVCVFISVCVCVCPLYLSLLSSLSLSVSLAPLSLPLSSSFCHIMIMVANVSTVIISIPSCAQTSDRVEECRFDLHNGSQWKCMSSEVLLSVCGPGASPTWPSPPPLCPSTLDTTLASNDLEVQIRRLVVQHRQVSL